MQPFSASFRSQVLNGRKAVRLADLSSARPTLRPTAYILLASVVSEVMLRVGARYVRRSRHLPLDVFKGNVAHFCNRFRRPPVHPSSVPVIPLSQVSSPPSSSLPRARWLCSLVTKCGWVYGRPLLDRSAGFLSTPAAGTVRKGDAAHRVSAAQRVWNRHLDLLSANL